MEKEMEQKMEEEIQQLEEEPPVEEMPVEEDLFEEKMEEEVKQIEEEFITSIPSDMKVVYGNFNVDPIAQKITIEQTKTTCRPPRRVEPKGRREGDRGRREKTTCWRSYCPLQQSLNENKMSDLVLKTVANRAAIKDQLSGTGNM